MDKIIGLGNALVDLLVTLKDDSMLEEMNLPKGSMQLIDGEKFQYIQEEFSKMKTHRSTGGSAGNTILGLAKLGAATGFIGKIGDDSFGKYFRTNLKRNKVEDHLLVSTQHPSGIASTFISPDGERTFGTFLGAAATLHSDDITLDMFKGGAYLYIEGYMVQDHDMVLRAIQLAKEAGLQVCLDMASYNIVEGDLDFFSLLLSKYVDIVFANEDEARAYTGKEADEALDILGKLCSVAVVKLGGEGSLIRKGTATVKVEAIPIKRLVDTTGAGDFYAAGFLYGLTCGYSLDKCARIGSILAGNVVQVIGTKLTKARWEKIKLNIDEVIGD